MSVSNDVFALLMDFKSKMKKWRFIAIILLVVSIFLFVESKKVGVVHVTKTPEKILSLTEDCIGKIEISGILLKNNFRIDVLKEIGENDKIKALLVSVDSPGGGVAESEILYEALRDVAKKKPIVVMMDGTAASGGYMISLASDYIIARNGTLTGSIGVLLQSFEATELAEKVGVKFMNYKSSESKGSPSPFEKQNPAVDKAIQGSIEDIYEFFVSLVAKRRGIEMARAYKVANGQVYTGRQALGLNLIDEIGGEKEGLRYLKSKGINVDRLEIEKISLERSIREFDLIDRFLGVVLRKGEKKSRVFGGKRLMFL